MPEPLQTPFHSWLVDLRRELHQCPELAYQEVRTAAVVSRVLHELGIPHRTGVGGTGVVAELSARKEGPTLALRADMDALPLEERNEVPYCSRNPGIMHACGHDGHMTTILGVARWLLEQEKWADRGCGKVLLLFQPAEEGGAGALAMIEDGALEGEKVEAIFAAHMHPDLPAGEVGLAMGVSNAASDSLHIRLEGKGGHGAHPHQCADPIVAGAYLVTHLQSIVSRSIPPTDAAVITIGIFQAGSASNIIPSEATLHGTLRTLDPRVRGTVLTRMEEVLEGIRSAHGVSGTLRVTPGYPLLVNDKGLTRFTLEIARDLLGSDRVHVEPARMGAEDFAYFLEKIPGVLLRLGCAVPGATVRHGLHSPLFDMDERALDVGVRLLARLLVDYARSASP